MLRGFNQEEFTRARAMRIVLDCIDRFGDDLTILIPECGAGAGTTDGAVQRIGITMTTLNSFVILPG